MSPMNLFRSIPKIIILLLIGFISTSFGETVAPSEKDKKEILTINGKRRTYYQLYRGELNYLVNGPRRIEIVARRAVPKKDKKEKEFGFIIRIDGQDSIEVVHQKNISNGVTSSQHQGHGYTKSGSYFFNLLGGTHDVKISPASNRSRPVLIRLLSNRFEKSEETGKYIEPAKEQEVSHLKGGNGEYRYLKLMSGKKMEFDFNPFEKVVVLSRNAFENWMPNEESYRIRVSRDSKIEGTYYFRTERSEVSTIKEDKEIVPGKRRTFEIDNIRKDVPYFIELVDKGRTVYVRLIGYE